MARETIDAPLGDIRAVSTAAGGTALTTALATIGFPLNTRWISITPRNFSTAVVAQVLLNPWLVVLRTQDNLDTSPIDFSNNAQDNDTGTSVLMSAQGAITAGHALYVASHVPFRGVDIDVDGTNGLGTATMAANYWNGSAWTALSIIDGTNSTATLDQDGTFTWTMPTGTLWQAANLNDVEGITHFGTGNRHDLLDDYGRLYWTRWEVSVALTDTSITLDSMRSLNRNTVYAELLSGQALSEKVSRGVGGISCVEARTDAGTANLVVNAAALGGDF